MIEKDHGVEFFEKIVTLIFPKCYQCAKAAAFALARELLSRVDMAFKVYYELQSFLCQKTF
jgi:hypothetical protein